jgi:hydroxymethylbilane synthase
LSLRSSGLRIGTRESRLARWQAEHVASAIRALPGAPEPELVLIRTEGDRIQDVPLYQVQGRAFFTKEIEEALFGGEVDVAVHSLKDLATHMPTGLALGAVMKREDSRDALLLREGLEVLPPGARVGTSSLRRRAFLARWRPDLELAELRGNVPTRIRKLDEGLYHGIVLAVAGVKRLGMEERISDHLPLDVMLPAVSQGAIGVQIREDDEETAGWVANLNHPATRWATAAERALLRRLEGGCQVPVGALGEVVEGEGGLRLRLRASLCSLDGKRAVVGEKWAPAQAGESIGVDEGGISTGWVGGTVRVEDRQIVRVEGSGGVLPEGLSIALAEELGLALAEDLLARGGDEILQEIRKSAGGR